MRIESILQNLMWTECIDNFGECGVKIISLTDIAYELRNLYEPRLSESLPYVGLEHIQPYTLNLSGLGDSTDAKSTKKRFRRNDILFGTLRPYFRKVVRAKHDGVCSTDISVIRAKDSIDTGFIFYLIASQPFIDYATATASGTRMPRAKWSILNQMDWDIPPQETRAKIASILSAYDDLIENNARRIKILEDMAATIYRKWFVEFRFPGHENVPMVNSELGSIPNGWEVHTLGDVTSVITKGTTPTSLGKQFTEEGVNFIKVQSIDEQGGILENKLAKIDGETHTMLKRSQLQESDILFSIAGAIGRVAAVTKRLLPANTNQAVAIVRPSGSLLATYLYQTLRSADFLKYSLERVVQTAQANVSLSVLSSAPVAIPMSEVLDDFSAHLTPIVRLVDALREKNQNLRQTRDLLVPKLISGEIDVSELDIDTDET